MSSVADRVDRTEEVALSSDNRAVRVEHLDTGDVHRAREYQAGPLPRAREGRQCRATAAGPWLLAVQAAGAALRRRPPRGRQALQQRVSRVNLEAFRDGATVVTLAECAVRQSSSAAHPPQNPTPSYARGPYGWSRSSATRP